jgi:DNA-binding MarR family transcriptional regulator
MLIDQWNHARPGTDTTGMSSTARVIRFRHALGQALDRYHHEAGMQSWAFDVLATLRRQPAPHRATHRALSELAMVSNSAVTQRIDKLVEQRLVARVPNPDSRREMYVQLTKKGFDLVESAIDRHTQICTEFMSPLTADEREEFNRLFSKLLAPLGL